MRPHQPRVGRARDDEALDDAHDLGDVEDEDVLALLVVGGAGGDAGSGRDVDDRAGLGESASQSCRSSSRFRSHASLPRRHCPPVWHGRRVRASREGVEARRRRRVGAVRQALPAAMRSRAAPRPHRPPPRAATTPICARRSRRRRRRVPLRAIRPGRARAREGCGPAGHRDEEVDRLARPRRARRRSVDDSSSRGTATRSTRQPSGAGKRRRLAVDDRERDAVAQLVDAVPRRHARGDVAPDDEKELALGRVELPRPCRSCRSGRRARARSATPRGPRLRRARPRPSRSEPRPAR